MKRSRAIARNTVDIINESKDEVSAWVEKGVEDASAIVPFNKKICLTQLTARHIPALSREALI